MTKPKIVNSPESYQPYFRLLEKFLADGYRNISRKDPAVEDAERIAGINRQLFHISDIISMRYLFTSLRMKTMFGADPDESDPSVFFKRAHPDDIVRYNLGRTKIITLGHNLFIEKRGRGILSSNFRLQDVSGVYRNFLFQCYFFYADAPHDTTFMLAVITDITDFVSLPKGFHFYLGMDLGKFRYPDDSILSEGTVFTARETIILGMIAAGMDSRQIAEKLFLSVHTINTHRRNILRKAGKRTTTEIVLEMMAQGMF